MFYLNEVQKQGLEELKELAVTLAYDSTRSVEAKTTLDIVAMLEGQTDKKLSKEVMSIIELGGKSNG